MPEIDFLLECRREQTGLLLLDVNNVYVNSINHGYDPDQFLAITAAERIAYGHIAGHYQEDENLLVDTHGSDVIDPVGDCWQTPRDSRRFPRCWSAILISSLTATRTRATQIVNIQQQHAAAMSSAENVILALEQRTVHDSNALHALPS